MKKDLKDIIILIPAIVVMIFLTVVLHSAIFCELGLERACNNVPDFMKWLNK